MRMNSSIILAGQPVNAMGAFSDGLRSAAMANAIGDNNRLRDIFSTQGANVLAGDPGALNALAGAGPAGAEMAMGVQSHRQTMQINQERLRLAREEGARAARRLSVEMTELERQREQERMRGVLRTALPALNRALENDGDVTELNQMLEAAGMPPVNTVEDALVLYMRIDGAAEDIGTFQGLANPQGPEWRTLTPQEVQEQGLNPEVTWQYNSQTGALQDRGGSLVTIEGDAPPAPDATLRDELQKDEAAVLARLQGAGNQAGAVMGDLEALRALSELAPSGPLEGRFAQAFPEFNDVAAVRQAIVRRVAPTLRVEGSGSTSDIEYAGMIAGLGNLVNSPEANMAIADMMIAKAELDLQRASVVAQYRREEIGYNEMSRRLEELNRVSIMPDSLRRLLSNASSATPSQPSQPAPGSGTGAAQLSPEAQSFLEGN